jgi:hypothetical protein
MTTPLKLAILNASTVLTDAQIAPIVAAVQEQVSRDFVPHWHRPATLHQVPKGDPPPKGMAWVAFLDTSDQAGALGYHDETNEGLPIGKVFAATDLQYGAQPSVTFSHEVLELLADPTLNRVRQVGGKLVAVEVGDPCEADADGYQIDGIQVSDFVFPAWFTHRPAKGAKFDFRGLLSGPFPALRPDGYISVYDKHDGWTQIYGRKCPEFRQRAPLGSRRERRRTPEEHWRRSEVRFG